MIESKSKNVVWWIGVKNDDHMEKYGNYEYFEYSRKTWEYWCKRNDVLLVPFEVPVEKDLMKFRINWQKALFVFDELEKREINYDQICLVDSSFMVKWDCPNFFDLTERKFTAWRDMDNMRWIYESIIGYKDFFKKNADLKIFDIQKYVNSGFIVFNKSHKEFFKSFKEFYYDNVEEFMLLQDKLVKRGTEQTPLNYWLQIKNIDVNTSLPLPFKLTHMHRKELFNYNWQLNEDKTPFFIKYGYNWCFNGIPKDQRNEIMKQTWEFVKSMYADNSEKLLNIVNNVSNKEEAKYTTSKKFKKDLIKYFKGKKESKYKNMTAIELGCCQGDSTIIYSNLFKKVIAVDKDEWNIDQATKKCAKANNTEFIKKDIYAEEWEFEHADVIIIDAGHTYDLVSIDIDRTLKYFDNPIIVIDDYGNPNMNIKKAIVEKIESGILKIDKFIGEDNGFKTAGGWVMNDREGVILVKG